jgi:hypothetical protein
MPWAGSLPEESRSNVLLSVETSFVVSPDFSVALLQATRIATKIAAATGNRFFIIQNLVCEEAFSKSRALTVARVCRPADLGQVKPLHQKR